MTARRCAGCGRPLRTSVGPYGPVCARRLTPATAPARRRTAVVKAAPPPDHHIPGQTELPLADHQPTLWSI